MAGSAPGEGPATPLRSASDQLRDLHAEIEALPDGLTVTEPARADPPPRAAPARRRRQLGRLASTEKPSAFAEIAAAPGDPMPMPPGLQQPDDAPPPDAVSTIEEDARLFAPTRGRRRQPIQVPDDVDPGGRPWTDEAAREPLPPLSPAELAARQAPPAEPPRRSWLMTGVVLVAAAAAVFVVITSHLDLGRTSAPSFAVNDLVALKDAADTSVTPTGHFLTTAPRIDLQATYVGAVHGDTLTLEVSDAGAVFATHTYDLTPGTSTAGGPLTPTGVDFKPGIYQVDAIWHGTLLRSVQFTVDPPPLPTAPTPTPIAGGA